MTDDVFNSATTDRVAILLVPGFWLGAWAWDRVSERLQADDDLDPHPITLPGLVGPGANTDREPETSVTLAHQIADVVARVDAVAAPVVLVGHSGGGPVVQGVVDQRPDRVRRVIYVDTGPLRNGTAMAAMTVDPPPDAEFIPLPEWEAWDEAAASLDGLDAAARAEFRRRAVDQPADVARSIIEVNTDLGRSPSRFDVPATMICSSIPSAQLQQLVAAGHIPSEIDQVRDVTWIDLPTGHWPMFSRPDDLATLVAEQARRH